MLESGHTAARLPVQDMERARAFYSEKLGLEPVEERPGGLLYRCASGEFALFQSAGVSPGTFTQMGWTVDDVVATVTELRSRGVVRAGEPAGSENRRRYRRDFRQLSERGLRREGRLVSRQRRQHARHRRADSLTT